MSRTCSPLGSQFYYQWACHEFRAYRLARKHGYTQTIKGLASTMRILSQYHHPEVLAAYRADLLIRDFDHAPH
jgi:hypothetical protein